MRSFPLKFDRAMADTLVWAMPLDDAARPAMSGKCRSMARESLPRAREMQAFE
jgi:hypothetical protein